MPNWPTAAYSRSTRERVSALLGLAGLLILRGEGETARDLLLRCCGIAPGRAEAWDTLGYALTLTGDKPLAESAVAEAQRLSPQTLEYALHRVDAARAAGSEEALLAWLEMAGDDDPAQPGAAGCKRRPAGAARTAGRSDRRAGSSDGARARREAAGVSSGRDACPFRSSFKCRGGAAPCQRTRSRQCAPAEHARDGAVPHAAPRRGAHRTARIDRAQRRAGA